MQRSWRLRSTTAFPSSWRSLSAPTQAQAVRLSELGGDRLFVMDKWRYHPGVLELARSPARSGSARARALDDAGRLGSAARRRRQRLGARSTRPLDRTRDPRPGSAAGVARSAWPSGTRFSTCEATLEAGPAWHTLTVSSRTSGVPPLGGVALRRRHRFACRRLGHTRTILRAGAADADGEQVETPASCPCSPSCGRSSDTSRAGRRRSRAPQEGADVVAGSSDSARLVLSP